MVDFDFDLAGASGCGLCFKTADCLSDNALDEGGTSDLGWREVRALRDVFVDRLGDVRVGCLESGWELRSGESVYMANTAPFFFVTGMIDG